MEMKWVKLKLPLTDLLFSSSPAEAIPLGFAAAVLVAALAGPMWPLVASNSRLLRLRLEEAAIPPPTPTPGAAIEVLPGKRPAAAAMPLLVEAGIAPPWSGAQLKILRYREVADGQERPGAATPLRLPSLILDDVDEHSDFGLRWRIG